MRFTNLAKTVRKVSGQAGRGSRRAWGTDMGAGSGRRKWCQISGNRQGRFPCTGAGMGNPDAERFGLGGGGVMTGKEKGVDREISIKQVRKQV